MKDKERDKELTIERLAVSFGVDLQMKDMTNNGKDYEVNQCGFVTRFNCKEYSVVFMRRKPIKL